MRQPKKWSSLLKKSFDSIRAAARTKYAVFDRSLYKKFENFVGKSDDQTARNLFYIFKFALIATFSILILNLILRSDFLGSSSWKLGDFGDFFGGVLNPILTFLMFIGLIITIIMQKTELSMARGEFQRTADALKDQSESSKKQMVENTFFNLLKIHGETAQSLQFNDEVLCCAINVDNENSVGRAVCASILSWISRAGETQSSLKAYIGFHETENHIVGHYFRGIFQILKFVDDADVSDIEKARYIRLLRAQLSTHETGLLLFHGLCPNIDDGQFKDLLIKFKMLEHIHLGYAYVEDLYHVSSRAGIASVEELKQYAEFTVDGQLISSAFGKNKTALKIFDPNIKDEDTL